MESIHAHNELAYADINAGIAASALARRRAEFMKRLKPPGGHVSDEDLARLLKAIEASRYKSAAQLRLLVMLALETTAKFHELVEARWSDLHPKLGYWQVPPTLAGEVGRRIPLPLCTASILRELTTLSKPGSDAVFPAWKSKTYASNQLCSMAVAAGLPNVRFWAIRREAICRMAFRQRTWTAAQIMAVGDIRDFKTAHPPPRTQRRARGIPTQTADPGAQSASANPLR